MAAAACKKAHWHSLLQALLGEVPRKLVGSF
jgi:hypothetical protein